MLTNVVTIIVAIMVTYKHPDVREGDPLHKSVLQ